MERITKTLSLAPWIMDAVQELADKERRSFTREAEVLLEAALARQGFKADGSRSKKTA